MNIAAYIALVLAAHAALGQSPTSRDEPSKPTIRSASALVIIPTLVQSVSGELVANLDASRVGLWDNGTEQRYLLNKR
jgi:heme A synthase